MKSTIILRAPNPTSPVSWTPTFTGITINSGTSSMRYWFEGKFFCASGYVDVATASGATNLAIQLPTGIQVDNVFYNLAAGRYSLGTSHRLNGSGSVLVSSTYTTTLFYDGADLDKIFFSNITGGSAFAKSVGSGLVGAGEYLSIKDLKVRIK